MSDVVQVDKMMHQLGFEGFDGLTAQDPQLFNLINGARVAFSDSDVEILHETYTDPTDRRNFGKQNYRDGMVTRALAEAAFYHDPYDSEAEIYKFQNFIAEHVDRQQRLGLEEDTARSTAVVSPFAVTIDGQFMVGLDTLPRNVVDLGSCLSSRSHVEDQLSMYQSTGKIFQHIAIARNHFVNKMMINKYIQMVGPEITRTLIQGSVFVGREDGAANSTAEFLDLQQKQGSTNVFDVVLCINPDQHMSRRDVLDSIPRMKDLLAEGGKLIVRATEKPTEHEFGISELAELAQDSGLTVAASLGYQTTGHLDVVDLYRGIDKPRFRQFRSIAFEKK